MEGKNMLLLRAGIFDCCLDRLALGIRRSRGCAAGIAKVLFFIFLIMFLVTFGHAFSRERAHSLSGSAYV